MFTIPKKVRDILKSRMRTSSKEDAIADLCKDTDSGLFASVYLFKDFVIKFSSSTHSDYKFIKKMRQKRGKISRLFPESQLFGSVLVQERVDPDYKLFGIYEYDIENLAEVLGVNDIHDGNIGWRRKNKKYVPVFIDVGIRSTSSKRQRARRSWMV